MALMYCDGGDTDHTTAQRAASHFCRAPCARELTERAVPHSRPERLLPWGHWLLYEALQVALEAIWLRETYHLHWMSLRLLGERIWAVIKNIILFQRPEMIR